MNATLWVGNDAFVFFVQRRVHSYTWQRYCREKICNQITKLLIKMLVITHCCMWICFQYVALLYFVIFPGHAGQQSQQRDTVFFILVRSMKALNQFRSILHNFPQHEHFPKVSNYLSDDWAPPLRRHGSTFSFHDQFLQNCQYSNSAKLISSFK